MARQTLPPGPARIPVIGSLPALSRDPLGFLNDLRRYGDVVYTRLGPTRLYGLYDPVLVEEVLIGRHRDCIKDYGTRELVALVGHGLLTSEGETWRRHRKLAAPPLSANRIAGYAQTMVACAERELAGLRDGEERDVHADMMRLTLEIVGKTLLGVDTENDAADISRIVATAMAYFDKRFWTWHGILPKWVPTREQRAFRRALVELDAIMARIVQRAREAPPTADDLLARLAHARDEDGAPLGEQQLRDEAVTMLLAGHETTALALSFAVYLLSRHPAAAERARAEVDGVLGGRAATVDDLSKLPWCDAVVRETLRLYPPAFLIGREVVRPFEIGGYSLPVGSQVMLPTLVIHRDERFFPEAERFLPERWLDGSTAALPRFAYFPFGGGPRVCIGNHFAMMEAVLVLASALQQVELAVPEDFTLALAPSVTLRPEHGVPVRVRRREKARDPEPSPRTL